MTSEEGPPGVCDVRSEMVYPTVFGVRDAFSPRRRDPGVRADTYCRQLDGMFMRCRLHRMNEVYDQRINLNAARSSSAKIWGCSHAAVSWRTLPKCIPVLQGRGSPCFLQMCDKNLGRRLVAEAPSRLVIQVAGKLGKIVLCYAC